VTKGEGRKGKRLATRAARAPAERGAGYDGLVGDIAELVAETRRTSARAVNALMTATYWEIGRRIVEYEQQGKKRAKYGEALLKKLAGDLTAHCGRGFGWRNLFHMRALYLAYPPDKLQTASTISAQAFPSEPEDPRPTAILQTSAISSLSEIATRFPLPWSAYVRLLAIDSEPARAFYEAEALRGGWSVRQLDRQIQSQFYERTALSRNKAAMLEKGARPRVDEAPSAEQDVKDPYVLEFLGLKDEYSETALEEALIRHLEEFLLELGGDFCFVGRQRRLRIGDEWYRVDLVFFHRRLRCLVLIDLKLGRFTHADAGQMHVYLSYAAEHWTQAGENPPVGLILCAQKNDALARYALDNLPNKILAAEYRTALPDEELLAAELKQTRRALERRGKE